MRRNSARRKRLHAGRDFITCGAEGQQDSCAWGREDLEHSSLFWPGAEQAAHKDELAEVVGIVVCREQGLAQDGLAGAVRDAREQVRFRVGDEFAHGFAVAEEGADAFLPGCAVGRRGTLWPVAGGEVRRDVFGVAAELEDVVLSEAGVFEQLPGGIRDSHGTHAAKFCGEILQGIRPVGMGLAPADELPQLLAQGFLVHGMASRHASLARLLGYSPSDEFGRASGQLASGTYLPSGSRVFVVVPVSFRGGADKPRGSTPRATVEIKIRMNA